MRKVKRKQIDFGGTDQQYVRGDGELDNFPDLDDNSISITFSSSASSISDIPNTPLTYDTSKEDIARAIIDKKRINWFITLTDDPSLVYKLVPDNAQITVADNNRSRAVFSLYWYDIQNNAYLRIYITIMSKFTTEFIVNMACHAVYSTEAFRSINHEPIVPGGSNINICDGFYFPNAVQDYDGNWYGAVVVGDQVWLAENLKSLHYSDGTEVTIGRANNDNYDFCYYPNDDQDNVDKYGMLYNWYAATRGVASNNVETPVVGISPGTQENGDNIWHIPSYTELTAFIYYIATQYRYKTDTAKSILKKDNIGDDTVLYNKTGFGLPLAGYSENSNPSDFDLAAFFYSSTLQSNGSGLNQKVAYRVAARSNNNPSVDVNYQFAYIKLSVRCICDLNPIQFRDWYVRKYGSLQHHLPQTITPSDIGALPDTTSYGASLDADFDTTTNDLEIELKDQNGNTIGNPVTVNIPLNDSTPDTPETVGDGTLSFKVNNESVTTFTANQEGDSSINFEEGVGISLAKDDEDRKIIISSESNHTVINKDIVVSSEHQSILYRYIVRCDLNNNELVVGDLDAIVNKSMAYSTKNNFVWTKTAQDVDVYFGLCKVQSTDGKYVFKLDIFDAITNKTETHLFGLIVDSPPDSTFTFISTCNWEIVVKSDYTKYALYGYLKVPNDFVGTVTLTPLRRVASGIDGYITCFENDATTVTAEYRWEVPLTGGTQALNSVTTLLGNTPSAGVNSIRIPFGNYYVNILGEFGGNLETGSKVSDSIINDYYLHTIEKRLQNISTAAAIYTLLNLPQPAAGDEGKILVVNSSGQYELTNPNNIIANQ